MSKKEFIDMALRYVKEMNTEISEKRKEIATKPFALGAFAKLWLQRLALAGLAIGVLMNEVWPKLKRDFNL